MDRSGRQTLIIALCTAAVFAALLHIERLGAALGSLISLLLPVIIGAIITLFLNVPVSGFERWIKRSSAKRKKTLPDKKCRALGFALTILSIALILVLAFTLLIPSLAESIKSISRQAEEKFPALLAYLSQHGVDAEWLEALAGEIDLEKLLSTISQHTGIIIDSVAGAVVSTVSGITAVVFALIISVYALLDMQRVKRHAGKLVRAYLSPKWAERVMRFCTLFEETFKKFLSGQTIEAVILGGLMFLGFLILGLPYPSVVGVLTAVCALIPYVGAFISFLVSVILALIVSPATALECAVVYGVIQFVENQFIYPRVVGGSVGLTPLYTLLAALLGGKLFGIIGILFFIPLAAVVYELVRSDASRRIEQKG